MLSILCLFLISALSSSRTGVVYNVTPSSVGVIVHKVVGNRYVEKRVNLRIEHVKHSKSRQEFLERVKVNSVKSREAKEKGGTCYHPLIFPVTFGKLLMSSHNRKSFSKAYSCSPT
jgi:hypothetical protein